MSDTKLSHDEFLALVKYDQFDSGLCDYYGTLRDLQAKIGQLIAVHGMGAHVAFDAGYNNVQFLLVSEKTAQSFLETKSRLDEQTKDTEAAERALYKRLHKKYGGRG